MNKMAAPTGQHGEYLFWLQLLNRLSDFHTVFTDDLRKRSSLFPDQGDWCHSSPLNVGVSQNQHEQWDYFIIKIAKIVTRDMGLSKN